MNRPVLDPALPRRALVTGAARRLGRAMTLALAEDGFDLALHVRRTDADATRLEQEIRALGRQAVLLEADLGNPSAAGTLVNRASERLGPLGVLVNNAATFPDDRLSDLQAAQVEAVLRVDLVAPLILTQAFARQMPEDARGIVVNMLDQRVLRPTSRRLSYTLAKSALWTATRMLARELAPRIRVAGIGPGIAIRDPDMDEATFERLSERAPLGWTGNAEEIVAALRYLIGAGSVTGQMLVVDGGMHLA
ncbi:SDR family oxidoreductase [Geminicoccus roseus]|uniref:SDR family oxidoreductase n=1 Tax=Geminicoccus roseus TaxID=404900 RepID=UPI000428521B|nr:SDR family oxidoreductase [Geminicoccus roseus]